MSEQLALLPRLLTAHLELTLLALLIGALVSLPLGVLVHRRSRLEGPVLGAASIIQTVPSLALLAVMVPVLAALELPSIGFLPAFIGLTLYSILPILRNSVAGLAGVDPALVEAARGVGMTPRQRLWRVELPLALPVIVAGLRTATVWTVGIATLSTPVGAASLGNYIFRGLQTRNFDAVLVGCVSAAGLSLLLDGLVRELGEGVRRRQRGRLAGALAVLAILYVATFWSAVARFHDDGDRPVRVGAKTFTEQYILSQALARRIQQQAGMATEVVSSLGSTVAFDALVAGELDVYVDYSGTIWATILRRSDVPDRAAVLDVLRRQLHDRYGVELVASLGFENTYAFAVRRADAERLGLRRLSDLVPHAPRLALGADYEFFGRPEWPAVQAAYGLSFREQRSMDSALMYQAAGLGDVDVITAFSTDGRIEAYDLQVLDDDRNAIPPYDAVVLASGELAADQPAVVEALRGLQDSLDAATMRRLNAEVDEAGRTPREVAWEWLEGVR